MYSDPVAVFTEGKEIPLGPVSVSKEEIIEFAAEFDPAPFHLDEEAAAKTMLGGLCASGWHTCCLTMRMINDALAVVAKPQGSPGFEECRWVAPVRPDDELSGMATVLSARRSASRPTSLVTRFHFEIKNQKQQPVLNLTKTILFEIAAKEED